MQCPVCKTSQLMLSERQGIEIDYCPQCRGVWLDRGELDKLIERGAATTAPARQVVQEVHAVAPSQRAGHHDRSHGHDYRDGYRDNHRWGNQRKKKSFLGEIFDFD